MSKKLQKIGAGLLTLAFVLFVLREPGISYGALIAAGLVDLYLVIVKDQTISQWIQDLTSDKWIDYVILTGLMAATFYRFAADYNFIAAMKITLPFLIMGLALHLFANKD